MKSITLIFLSSFILSFFTADKTTTAKDSDVQIELINDASLEFDFTIKHEPRRQQIQIRSHEALKSLRLMAGDKKKKSYSIIGSNLVMLPMTDFTKGETHVMEIKFLRSQQIVMAKINVSANYPMAVN